MPPAISSLKGDGSMKVADIRVVAMLHLKRIQSTGRAYIRRHHLSNARRSKAATKISRWFFSRPTISWRYQRLFIAVIRAAIKIQKVWRGGRVRQALVGEIADHAFRGAVLLQKCVDVEIYEGAFQAAVGADLAAQRERDRQAATRRDPTNSREFGLIAIYGCPPHIQLLQSCASGFQSRRLLGQSRAHANAMQEESVTRSGTFEDETLLHRRLLRSQCPGYRLSLSALLRAIKKRSRVPRDYNMTFISEGERVERLGAIEEATKMKYMNRMEAWVFAARQKLMDQRLSTATSFLVFLNRCAVSIQRWYRHCMKNRHLFPQVPFVHSRDEVHEDATQIVERRSVLALRKLQHKQLLSAWSKVTEVRRPKRPLVSFGAKWERKRQQEAADYAATLPVICARGVFDSRLPDVLASETSSAYEPIEMPPTLAKKKALIKAKKEARSPGAFPNDNSNRKKAITTTTTSTSYELNRHSSPASSSSYPTASPNRSNRPTPLFSSTTPPNPSRRGVASNSSPKEIGAFTRSLVLPPIQPQDNNKPLSHNPPASHHHVGAAPRDTAVAVARRTLAPIGSSSTLSKGKKENGSKSSEALTSPGRSSKPESEPPLDKAAASESQAAASSSPEVSKREDAIKPAPIESDTSAEKDDGAPPPAPRKVATATTASDSKNDDLEFSLAVDFSNPNHKAPPRSSSPEPPAPPPRSVNKAQGASSSTANALAAKSSQDSFSLGRSELADIDTFSLSAAPPPKQSKSEAELEFTLDESRRPTENPVNPPPAADADAEDSFEL